MVLSNRNPTERREPSLERRTDGQADDFLPMLGLSLEVVQIEHEHEQEHERRSVPRSTRDDDLIDLIGALGVAAWGPKTEVAAFDYLAPIIRSAHLSASSSRANPSRRSRLGAETSL